jgi:hypothetical protein
MEAGAVQRGLTTNGRVNSAFLGAARTQFLVMIVFLVGVVRLFG